MRISDWSSDVCSSDLRHSPLSPAPPVRVPGAPPGRPTAAAWAAAERSWSAPGTTTSMAIPAWLFPSGVANPADVAARFAGQAFNKPLSPRPRPVLCTPLPFRQIGRAHVCTPVTKANLECRLLLEKIKQLITQYNYEITYT